MTELVFILDRSGSMGGLEEDTIGGFNSMMEKQRKESGEAYVTTVLFDDRKEIVHDRVQLEKVPPLTEKEYYVRGSTALLDAVGSTIRHIAFIHKYARHKDRPERTLFVIITDGMENASWKYNYEQVQKMITEQKEKHGWDFLFLGANIDAAAEAKRIGIDEDFAVRYSCDSVGTALNFDAVSEVAYRVCKAQRIEPTWKSRIEDNFKKRGKR